MSTQIENISRHFFKHAIPLACVVTASVLAFRGVPAWETFLCVGIVCYLLS